nr:UDP-glucose 4-epimerase GalE [Spirochaetota bacterium]
SHINKELAKRNYETIVFDNLIYGHKEAVKWGEFVLADLNNIEQIRLIFKKYPIKAVMHFAAYAFVGESVTDPQKYYINNIANTLNLLQVMIEYKVKYFIFSSTCATYGVPQKEILTEDQPQNPINPYGFTKLCVEKALIDYSSAYDMKYVILRYFNASGADPDSEIGENHTPETHLIPLVLDAAIGKRPCINIFGNDYKTKDGTCVRDYIHVNDLAEAHILGLEYLMKENKSDIFNLGNGEGFTVKEIIEHSRKITGKNIIAKEVERRAGDPDMLVGSSKKIIERLGWKPKFADIDNIIKTAWGWHKKLNQGKI